MGEPLESLPLPEHPVLRAWASALNDVGYWANVLDAEWRYVFVTDEMRLSYRDMGATTSPPIGAHFLSAETREFFARTLGEPSVDVRRTLFLELGPYVLAGTPGGRDGLRRVIDPALADLVDELQPVDLPPVWTNRSGFTTAGAQSTGPAAWFRIDDRDGRHVGTCMLPKPAAGMSHLARAGAIADLAHRLVRTADRCIIDAGGIVGRHVGDGIVAFFLAETAGSESAAARASITAVRAVRDTLPDIAARSEVSVDDCSLRFGLHWGSTLYMGSILTAGRSEVTALGDEVNEAARIEACASGGRTLASKSLIERLDRVDADALGLNPGHTTYTPLAELTTATDKARRDAPSIAVCEI